MPNINLPSFWCNTQSAYDAIQTKDTEEALKKAKDAVEMIDNNTETGGLSQIKHLISLKKTKVHNGKI